MARIHRLRVRYITKPLRAFCGKCKLCATTYLKDWLRRGPKQRINYLHRGGLAASRRCSRRRYLMSNTIISLPTIYRGGKPAALPRTLHFMHASSLVCNFLAGYHSAHVSYPEPIWMTKCAIKSSYQASDSSLLWGMTMARSE